MVLDSYIEPSNAAEKEFQSIKDVPKLRLVSENVLEIGHEDHTLMNLLQNVIVENREIHTTQSGKKSNKDEFLCGYVIPHPSEQIVEFKVIGDEIFEVLQQGLTDIEEMCLVAAERLITLKGNTNYD